MAEEQQWQRDAFAFTNDLYFFLFTKRKMASYLPTSIKGYSAKSHYTEFVGKAILYLWHSFRDCQRVLISDSHPEMAENSSEFLEYLGAVCPGQEQHEGENIFLIVADMSAQLFEICYYLMEQKNTKFLRLIQTGWSRTFGQYYKDRFFASGGWEKFRLESINCAIQYDMTELFFPESYIFNRKDIERVLEFKYPSADTDPIPESGIRVQIPGNVSEVKAMLDRALDGKEEEFEIEVPVVVEVITKPPDKKQTAVRVQSETRSSEATEDSYDENERVPPLHPGIDLGNLLSNGNENVEDPPIKNPSFQRTRERMSNQYKERRRQLHRETEFDYLHSAGSKVIGGARRKTYPHQKVTKEASEQNQDRVPPLHPGLELGVSASRIRESLSGLNNESHDRSLTDASEASTGGYMENPSKMSPYLATDRVLPLDTTQLHDQITKNQELGLKSTIQDHSLPDLSALSIDDSGTAIPNEREQDSIAKSEVKEKQSIENFKKSKKHKKKSKR